MDQERVPSRQEAEAMARVLLADLGKQPHVQAAAEVADSLCVLFPDPRHHRLLVAAATLHDIGYAPRLHRTGFHPLDGGLHLRELGYSAQLVALVANHSRADLLAVEQGYAGLRLPQADLPVLVADALTYSDMHAAPDGRVIDPEERMAEIVRRHDNPAAGERIDRLREAIDRVREALDLATPLERGACA